LVTPLAIKSIGFSEGLEERERENYFKIYDNLSVDKL
jgi:hypothetical protein